jgi:DnaJ-domain-containing protein 1
MLGHSLELRLETLDGEFRGRLHFRCVGPLPPYSFAGVEVEMLSFEAIDEARKQLGLGEAATLDEIKGAYRRLASESHPDHNPNNSDAGDRMTTLKNAFNLIAVYAQNTGQTTCRFDGQTVEKTLLTAIRRQETALAP